jgi:hypothetical protein
MTISGTSGDPERAKNGAEAAQDLLDPKNPFFYQTANTNNPYYDPENAKAKAFLATLSDYEQKGDYTDISQLLNTLGPTEAGHALSRGGESARCADQRQRRDFCRGSGRH